MVEKHFSTLCRVLLLSKPEKWGLVGVLAFEVLTDLFSYIDDVIRPVVAMLTGLGLRGCPDSRILTEAAEGVSVPPPLIALGDRPENGGRKKCPCELLVNVEAIFKRFFTIFP